ncbi:5'-nucleotidase C-terminal domain-containing protein [Adhaeribacter sp. BT258]|uniref:5'-nucleotidase C-terminal domain-containing protein n=1 Tax=Adhaeribacter terrigena TaxID=2793070 RepID=A0ABS1BY01_9BACT|nr:5'-nucleotidase [Adhaeribacter terrigena]MBK0401970.1 5'-nucleotidase C-terminal domain-containing protein [Adhaeribacter terrigena]
MRFHFFKIVLLSLGLGLSVSCQRTWHGEPALQKTMLGVTATIAPDAQAEKTIAPYRAQVTKQMAEVIGVVPVALEKLAVESPVGNFVADLQRIQAEKLTGKPIDLGLMTAGGVRTPLRQGNLTVGDIFELMPFENELMVITVPAVVVKQLLNYASQPHIYPLAPKTLSTSNVAYQILNNQPQNILIGGQPFDSTRTYTIALSDYLAKGGDNLEFITNQVSSQKVGLLLRDAIIKHIKELTAEGKPVEAKIDGRVQVIVPNTPVEPKQ